MIPAMKCRVTVDNEGGITIPEQIREGLRLEPGDALDMEVAGEHIMLRAVPETPSLTQEHGVWVLHTGQPLPACADDLCAQIRKDRETDNC
jgi:AbrB family looped-hinge helix DNA binding protein